MQVKSAFLLLIACQAIHSIEEIYFKLWEVFAPARYISNLISDDPNFGFTIANLVVVSLGLICCVLVFKSNAAFVRAVIWVWVIIEYLNFGVHSLQSLIKASYFPGVYTAPLLLSCSIYLTVKLTSNESKTIT